MEIKRPAIEFSPTEMMDRQAIKSFAIATNPKVAAPNFSTRYGVNKKLINTPEEKDRLQQPC